jgi:hypothetical protein
MRRFRGKRQGTPAGEPRPQGIDSWSGFKVDLASLKKQWDGNYTQHPDIRNPQDFVRGVKDDQSLPFARPEAPDEFISEPITWESGAQLEAQGLGGQLVYEEGSLPQGGEL